MTPGPEHHDPWHRFGWLVSAVWLVFLAFPLHDAVTANGSRSARGATVTLLVVFGAIYAMRVTKLSSGETSGWDHSSWRHLVALVVLALLTIPTLGLGVISLLPFLQSFAVFALPRPWNWWWVGGGLAIAFGAPMALGAIDDWLSLGLVVTGVTVAAGGGRLMADHGHRYAAVQERLTVTAERERVARDVHDVLGHSLTVVTVKAELAERLIDRDPTRAQAELREIQDLSRQALAEVRSAVGGLRVARLSDELATAASALRSSGIAADLPDEPSVVDPRHRPVAAWLVREAVTNVVRHSGASVCSVTLGPTTVRVVDDGRGLGGSTPGNGLRGLRERVEQSGAELLIGPGTSGVGTVVEARW